MQNNNDELSFDFSPMNTKTKSGANISPTTNYLDETMNRIGVANSGFSNLSASGKLVNINEINGPIMLNLGCGLDVRDGFINIDLFSDNPNVVRMDIRKLDFPDNSIDFILASDVLEHFSHHQTDEILSEWNRVLKPNAPIIIRCPSLKLQIKAYTNNVWNADVASFMIFGGQTNPGDYHCNAFDEASIRQHLSNAGFNVTQFEEIDTPQNQGYINLNMTVKAVKIDTSITNITTMPNKNDLVFDNSVSEVQQTKYIQQIHSAIDGMYLNIVWEGSQFVYSSLALVNREHCKNLIDADVANITIIPYEKDTFSADINPNYNKLKQNDIRYKPDVNEEIENLPYVWIRHQWPPKDEIPQGSKWIIMQPWEFNKIPQNFMEIFSIADEIWTPSNFSRKAFIESGLNPDKIQIIPNGIDPQLFNPAGDIYKLKTQKKFKFLYVGGTTYRKGFDVLIQAYKNLFNINDDVCLVIKNMGDNSYYKQNNMQDIIKNTQNNPNCPEIEYIEDEISDEEIASLYRACNVFVSPYRGEGFSLPTLEAMASGLPVIVTKGGATDDYTTDENTWYISSKKVIAKTEKILPSDTEILEPDINELIQTLEYVYKVPTINFSQGLIGSYLARKKWTWKRATMKILDRLDFLYNTDMAKSAQSKLAEVDDEFIILGEAELAFANDEYEKAMQLFIVFIEDNSTKNNNFLDKYLVHSFNRLAQISISSNKYVDAYKYAEAANTISPDNPDSKWISATIMCAEENYIEALELINPIVENWKKYKFISTACIDLEKHILLLGDILFFMGDLETSAKVFESALKLNNYSAEACFGVGKCYKEAEMYDDAKKMFEWAIKYNPDYDSAITELDELNNKLGI